MEAALPCARNCDHWKRSTLEQCFMRMMACISEEVKVLQPEERGLLSGCLLACSSWETSSSLPARMQAATSRALSLTSRSRRAHTAKCLCDCAAANECKKLYCCVKHRFRFWCYCELAESILAG